MMKNNKLFGWPAQNKQKLEINNILLLFCLETHFTKNEISWRSIHLKSFFGGCPGVSTSVSEVSLNKSQHYRRIPCYFNKSIALNHGKCINTGEPAAVLVFPIKIKVVEDIRPESSAAGSLFGRIFKERSLGVKVSKLSEVSEVSEEEKIIRTVIGHWEEGLVK